MCTEDQFEQLMDFFEQYSRSSQPYAMVDNAPVIDFDEMVQSAEFQETVDENARPFAKEIYDHWKARRTKRGNRPLMPQLKVETNQDTDDGDPYICFRRREVRQIRKTRGRDAQSIEKLRKLRKELEDARKLIALVRQRELSKRELLAVERTLFEQRIEVKNTKRKLGIKGDDDDLINQKVRRSEMRNENLDDCSKRLTLYSLKRKRRPSKPKLSVPRARSCVSHCVLTADPQSRILFYCKIPCKRRKTTFRKI